MAKRGGGGGGGWGVGRGGRDAIEGRGKRIRGRTRDSGAGARLGPGKISVLFWLDNLLSALVCEYHIKDGKQQGLMPRQLVEGPFLTQLTRKIAELPALRCASDRGEATFADYAAALIACADPDDALACH